MRQHVASNSLQFRFQPFRALLKKLYEKVLISYREENEEEYAGIIQEFIERSPKIYDRDGKLDHVNWRHDPLEDISK